MRVVFLDVDGVLNSVAWMRGRGGRGSHMRDLDHAAVVRVQAICDRTGAVVVISSAWRCMMKLAALRNLLRAHGLTAKVIGKTPDLNEPRGEEIQAWLDGAPEGPGRAVDAFVILDDESDVAHLGARLVRTSFETGLLDEHVERAVALLLESGPP